MTSDAEKYFVEYYNPSGKKETVIAVDDDIFVKGKKTTGCLKMLSDFIAPFDATVVERLEKAGFAIAGKTGIQQSGAAAAIAEGIISYALGSDSNGKNHQTAVRNGISFIKPTYGTVSRYGLIAKASSMEQIGVYTKSIREGFKILEKIAGYDEKDGTSYPDKTYYFDTKKSGYKGLEIGIPECFYDLESPWQKDFAAALRDLGAEISGLELKYLEQAETAGLIISSAEFSNNISRFDGVKYGYRTENYKNAEDLILNSRTEAFQTETKLKAMLGSFVLSEGKYDIYYDKAMRIRRLLKEGTDKALTGCDVIMIPILKEETGFGNKQAYPVLSLGNLTGCPVLSVPYRGKDNDVCTGVQFIAKEFNENTLLQLGGAVDEL